MAKYLVCTGFPDHKYLALLITPSDLLKPSKSLALVKNIRASLWLDYVLYSPDPSLSHVCTAGSENSLVQALEHLGRSMKFVYLIVRPAKCEITPEM